MIVSALVRGAIRARFTPADAEVVEALLAATPLPFLDAPNRDRERDRVHLAILKLSGGNAVDCRRHVAVAKEDWRDTLVAAGLGHGNWPEVLATAGFPVP